MDHVELHLDPLHGRVRFLHLEPRRLRGAVDGHEVVEEVELRAVAVDVLLERRDIVIHPEEHAARVAELEATDDLVVVYCHHGIRSLSGAAILSAAGFPNVVSLAGGIDRWSLAVDPAVPRY